MTHQALIEEGKRWVKWAIENPEEAAENLTENNMNLEKHLEESHVKED